MSIQPIDMHIMINKTSETSRIAHEHERYDGEQLVFADQLKKETEHELKHVIDTNKSEGQKIKDEEKKREREGKKNKGGKKNDAEEKKQKKSALGSRFDVSI